MVTYVRCFSMAPTFDKAWQDGLQPLIENKISEQEAFTRIASPFKHHRAHIVV